MKAEYLRKYIGQREEKAVRDALIPAGVIECDNHYIKGEKSKGFRLGETYRNAPYHRLPLSRKRCSKVAKFEKEQRQEIKLPVHLHLRDFFQNLQIADGAESFIQTPEAGVALDMLRRKEVTFSFCRFGRVHSNLTRLSKRLRPFLRYNGMPLTNIDIKNSQPLFMSLILKGYKLKGKALGISSFRKKTYNPYSEVESQYCVFEEELEKLKLQRKNKEENQSQNDENQSSKKEEISLPPLLPLHYDVKNIISSYSSKTYDDFFWHSDEELFLNLVQGGKLYETLMEESNQTREQTKETLFRCWYGKRKVPPSFRNLFPTVADVANDVKKKDYRRLAQLLQTYESTLMIYRVCERIRLEKPGVPIFTIHDSIMTTPENVETVKAYIRQAFREVGLSVSLKEEGSS